MAHASCPCWAWPSAKKSVISSVWLGCRPRNSILGSPLPKSAHLLFYPQFCNSVRCFIMIFISLQFNIAFNVNGFPIITNYFSLTNLAVFISSLACENFGKLTSKCLFPKIVRFPIVFLLKVGVITNTTFRVCTEVPLVLPKSFQKFPKINRLFFFLNNASYTMSNFGKELSESL